MTARRFFSITGASAVGLIAGIASYSHMREVALDTNQGVLIADLIPFSVDGLVLVGTLAIGDGRRSRFTAWLAFLVGVGASLAANVFAADPTAGARCVSAWPSVAFLLAVEVLIRGGRKATVSSETVEQSGKLAGFAGEQGPANLPTLAPVSEISDTAIASDPGGASYPKAPRAPRRTPSTAAKVAAARVKMPDVAPAVIAAKIGVSESTVRRHDARTVEAAPFVQVGTTAGESTPANLADASGGESSPRVNGHPVLAEVLA